MKAYLVFLFTLVVMLLSCSKVEKQQEFKKEQWNLRKATTYLDTAFVKGKTYLSVYSEIYSGTEHITHHLTATASIRNVSTKDTLYVTHASYYDTHGNKIRDYLDTPIFVRPMETVFIVIEEKDNEGGTGGNFLFTWEAKQEFPEPIFESVMISTSGQQGLSFSVQGKRVE